MTLNLRRFKPQVRGGRATSLWTSDRPLSGPAGANPDADLK